MNLLQVIEEIQQKTNKIESINYGGCVHFAHFLSQSLKKYGYSHNIVAINTSKSISKQLVEEYGCCHMVVYIRNIGYVDSKNIYKSYKNFFNRYYCESYISYLKFPKYSCIEELRNKDIWNTEYDKKNNKRIKQIITSSFKKIRYERKN